MKSTGANKLLLTNVIIDICSNIEYLVIPRSKDIEFQARAKNKNNGKLYLQ